MQKEEPAGVPLDGAWLLASDALQEIIEMLETREAFRLFLAVKPSFRPLLPKVSSLHFFAPQGSLSVDGQLRWTKLLQEGCILLNLRTLNVYDVAQVEVLALLVRSAPNLSTFGFDWHYASLETDEPASWEPLCSGLSGHRALRKVTINFLIPARCRLAAALPRELQSLLFNILEGDGEELPQEFFSDIAATCPHLTELAIQTEHPIPMAAYESLKTLTNLTALRIDGYETSQLFDASEAGLEALDRLLPKPKGGRWRSLHCGGSFIENIFLQGRGNIPLLREVVRRIGFYPTLGHLYLAPFDPTSALLPVLCATNLVRRQISDEKQLEYFQFVLEECKLAPPPCHCDVRNGCQSCWWFSAIIGISPNTARFVIEKYFLPYVEARSKLPDDISPGTIATLRLELFQSGHNCDTALNYIQNPTYPLAIVVGEVPTFLALPHNETRRALIARAKDTGVDLGLDRILPLHDYDWMNKRNVALEPGALVHASSVEPKFFLRHLAAMARVGIDDEIGLLAAACPFSVPKRLELLREGAALFAAETDAASLFKALAALLPGPDLTSLVNEMVLRHPFDKDVLEWLLEHDYKFDQFRSEQGENWLHFQLRPLVKKLTTRTRFDQALLKEMTLSGDTPVHRLCAGWTDSAQAEADIDCLQPHLAFFAQNGLWQCFNRAGQAPLALTKVKVRTERLRGRPV